jgi:hypothetical protein
MKIAEYNEMMAYLMRPAQEAKLVDDLEPGSLKDELLKDFDPSQETYEEYLRRKSMRETAAYGGRIGFEPGGKADLDMNKTVGETNLEELKEFGKNLSKKEKIAQGLEKGRVSTKIDEYVDAMHAYNMLLSQARAEQNATIIPKSLKSFLESRGLKEGTYGNLKAFDLLPEIELPAKARNTLANDAIRNYNGRLKFQELNKILKDAKFTDKEINALQAGNLDKADKAGDKARKAYDFIFNNPKNLDSEITQLFNPRAKIAELTGLTGETISKKFSVQAYDPEGYDLYTKLGNPKVQSAIRNRTGTMSLRTFKNQKDPLASQAKATALRKERLDKAAKLAGEGVADINAAQKDVVKLLNDHYKKNPEELLGNTKLRNILDLTLEDGEIVKKNKYVTDDDFLELIKKKKGLFTMDHVDEVQFEKLSTEFPIFKQLATYNTNSGLIKSMKSYISKNQNSKDPVIQNKIKKQISFLEDLKLRVDTPTGRVGSKEVIAAVDRKAGILPNFLAQLKALDIRIPSKAKAALYVIGGIGASTLAQAEEVSKTPFPGIKPEGSPRQINPEKEEEGFTTGEKLAGAGVAGGAYAARKPILKTLGKIARPVGRVLGAPSLAGGLALSELLSDDPNLGVAGADLLLPELTKQAGVRGVLANPFQLAEKASKFGKIGRGIASIARAPSMFTPIGLGLMGIEGVRMGMREQDRINEMRMNEPDKYEEYLDELESYGDFSA